MSVTAKQVQDLRKMSGAGMMDCKAALSENNADIDLAFQWLREKGIAKAQKKSTRDANEGLVSIMSNDTGTVIVEINSETDFAIKDSNFIAFTDEVHNYTSAKKVDDISEFENSEIEEKRKALIQTIGENIQLRRLETLSVDSGMSAGVYLHSDSKLGALVVVSGGDESLAKDIAMHVAAFNPLCLSQDDIDPQVLEREKAIYLVQAEESGKPQEIMEKMIEGKLNRFLSEVSLMSQGFVKDPDTSIQKLLEANNAKIESFSRLKVGEGIEVSTKSFADEVAEQLK